MYTNFLEICERLSLTQDEVSELMQAYADDTREAFPAAFKSIAAAEQVADEIFGAFLE